MPPCQSGADVRTRLARRKLSARCPASVHRPVHFPPTGDIMACRKWTITTHHTGRPREVEVVLYDKLAHLRSAATRHSSAWESDPEAFPGALAVTHGFQRIRIHPDGTEEEHPLAVILRFARNHLTAEIIVHEVAHASQHLYGLDCIPAGATAKDHFDAANETFAHLASDLFSAVWSLLDEERQ